MTELVAVAVVALLGVACGLCVLIAIEYGPMIRARLRRRRRGGPVRIGGRSHS